ncbi:glycosyl hydrolase family 95 catalytic domain-containing protein [Bacteroides oleiciplenus]|uniref:Glycoside hydrolase family 65 central catalytic domain-containing protein n=1 Tax=Bacteroides oleiciplenus YIT 12058 TaxID=742727 RepID=K9ETJ4_9BACE|nr:glycoside hydrolase family 65 protein [Bacteroides oleiciplenus]EKU92510.1 hypothetical protein HMPREF9447_00167 [Bacteroides oleiciplenus YIT 12058]
MKTRVSCFFLLVFFFVQMVKGEDADLWQLHASDISAPYVGAPMANGGIGILPWKEPFSVRQVILNHVFDTDGPQGVSRVLKGINPFLLSMDVDGKKVDSECVANWSQYVDMKEATHNSSFQIIGKADINYSICALRNMPYAGLIRVNVKVLSDMSLKVAARMDVPQEYSQSTQRFRKMRADATQMYMLQSYATSTHRQQEVSASSAFIFDEDKATEVLYDEMDKEIFFTMKLRKGDSLSFALIGSVCSTRDFSDPYNEAERQVIYAIHEGTDALMVAHCRLWNELWESDILIEGDDEAQRVVRFALFNLYSSCREGSRLSISPMGLSSQGYNGHIFWDSELWMFPPMLMLNKGIAKSMIDYRIDRLVPARKKAMAYGYKGAMFPWESDDYGEESTPTFALTGPLEHHVTADISIACWNYYCLTRDEQWLRTKAFPLMKEVADFWASRVERNDDGSYSIRNVVGADEYANGIDDNAFTNAAVIRALEYACEAATICNEPVPEIWKEISRNICILRFKDGVTREHATYDGEMIKQADVNLLGYPLYFITDAKAQKKDMEYYADRIDPQNGPAMSYSIFCVQYARMGDVKRAYEMFCRCYQPNLRAPFGVLAETATSDNPYFMTGAGGLLQAVINGFCGLQITDSGIVQLPSSLPEHWKKVIVKGIGPEKKAYVRENR